MDYQRAGEVRVGSPQDGASVPSPHVYAKFAPSSSLRTPEQVEAMIAKVKKIVSGVADADVGSAIHACDFSIARAVEYLRTAKNQVAHPEPVVVEPRAASNPLEVTPFEPSSELLEDYRSRLLPHTPPAARAFASFAELKPPDRCASAEAVGAPTATLNPMSPVAVTPRSRDGAQTASPQTSLAGGSCAAHDASIVSSEKVRTVRVEEEHATGRCSDWVCRHRDQVRHAGNAAASETCLSLKTGLEPECLNTAKNLCSTQRASLSAGSGIASPVPMKSCGEKETEFMGSEASDESQELQVYVEDIECEMELDACNGDDENSCTE